MFEEQAEVVDTLKFYTAGRLQHEGYTLLARHVRAAHAELVLGHLALGFDTHAEWRYADKRRVLIADALCEVADKLVPLFLTVM